MNTKLTNIKMFKGRDGYELNVTLWVNEIKTAHVHDDGNGGCFSYDVLDKELFESFEKELKKCPSVYIPEMNNELRLDKDLFINLLHLAQEEGKDLKMLMQPESLQLELQKMFN